MSLCSSPSHGATVVHIVKNLCATHVDKLLDLRIFIYNLCTTKLEILVVLFKIKHFVGNSFLRNDTRVGYVNA